MPSNCSTAILMPINGVKRHSKHRDDTDQTFIGLDKLNGIKDDIELSTIDPMLQHSEKNCDR